MEITTAKILVRKDSKEGFARIFANRLCYGDGLPNLFNHGCKIEDICNLLITEADKKELLENWKLIEVTINKKQP